MASRTIENYLKQLWLLEHAVRKPTSGAGRSAGHFVTMGQLSESMGVTPGTTTTMVKAMADAGLARYTPRAGVRLTRAGEKLALHVLRRHRLVELFLVEILAIDWAHAHEEAEELEHVISDTVLLAIDRLLGHPSADPHGDPIPSERGMLEIQNVSNLAEVKVGTEAVIVRIMDQSREFLTFARQNGLVPRAAITIAQINPGAGAMLVHSRGHSPVSISLAVAAKFMISIKPAEHTKAAHRRDAKRRAHRKPSPDA
ncbi:MAG: metal-dependent transcriptional regulator [Phycisphaerae bacterium]